MDLLCGNSSYLEGLQTETFRSGPHGGFKVPLIHLTAEVLLLFLALHIKEEGHPGLGTVCAVFQFPLK